MMSGEEAWCTVGAPIYPESGPTLWQQLRKGPHMGVLCWSGVPSHTFGHTFCHIEYCHYWDKSKGYCIGQYLIGCLCLMSDSHYMLRCTVRVFAVCLDGSHCNNKCPIFAFNLKTIHLYTSFSWRTTAFLYLPILLPFFLLQ